jgi:hypothetical protein
MALSAGCLNFQHINLGSLRKLFSVEGVFAP